MKVGSQVGWAAYSGWRAADGGPKARQNASLLSTDGGAALTLVFTRVRVEVFYRLGSKQAANGGRRSRVSRVGIRSLFPV
ncbi:hypothetical protein NDU88_009791 [Pleurodeles waltl]|uniref:Uncharacterized protein n=1 Tax=Pleurodeles waltl TaxID=8319 RepID=A0AAV7RZF7_PLEWA|nr:hypothetical protein NDU88_009791 [Pleurodeles waltl]